jgi:hypothetical protein
LPEFAEKLTSYPRQGNAALFAKLDSLIAALIAFTGRSAKA